MSYQLGDIVFSRNGKPGVVLDRNAVDQSLVVQEEGEEYENSRKYGYINGLSPSERRDYQVIIDEARQHKSADLRVETLRKKIEEMKFDPSKHVLRRYLESEMGHIINSEGVKVETYTVEESKLF